MLTAYCPNKDCAQPVYYTLIKPTFCPYCGGSLTLGMARASKTIKTPEPQDVTEEDEPRYETKKSEKQRLAELRKKKRFQRAAEEYDEDIDLPDTSNLEFEIVGGKVRQKLTLGELGKQKKTGFQKRPVENITKEENIKKFIEEAKGSAKPIEIEDNE